ncbi:hypothetical protein [Schumannella sp. 10F1B-5-1]|uniref:hypothetical protein n=1 Tax=Schumannella sp. 10F1B-5-1 TaxID=2590780 RepID=UPI0015E86934|nr:hypothetical protein [Schumannella sp. 10F1B-5-1]
MTSAPPRRRRPIDPRLLIGLALVLLSVAGVVGIVAVTDRTAKVYAAGGTLTAGERVTADDLVLRSVALDGADKHYLRDGQIPKGGLVVTRTITGGELIPSAAVARDAEVESARLVLQVDGSVGSAVTAGADVDVWGAATEDRADPDGEVAPPAVLAAGATVVQVLDDKGLVAGSSNVAVEVLVPRERVARLLQAVADGQRLTLVGRGGRA